LVEIWIVVLLAAHLLLVDVAMTGPLVCVWLERRETRYADRAAGRVGRALARMAMWSLAGGMALGGLLLAIRWSISDRGYFEAVATIPEGRLWFGLAELIFYFVCMGAYTLLWNRLRNWRLVHRGLAIAAASNLLIHFPALFAIVSVVSTRAQLWGEKLDRSGYWTLLLDGEVLSRVVHVWLAAFAVTGVALMALASRPAPDASSQRLIHRGACLALACSLLQLPAGLWLAFEMPDVAREPLFGGDLLASGLFIVSLLLAMQLLHTLASVALGEPRSKQIHRSVAIILVLVLLMVGTRSRLHYRALATLGLGPEVAEGPPDQIRSPEGLRLANAAFQ
jgi:hypothetical protein